jgi:acyl-coenzyme A synthetase/AMP-(fatty) acid ligase
VEAALLAHRQVRDVAVITREQEQSGTRQLVAYVVGEVPAGELRAHLRAS